MSNLQNFVNGSIPTAIRPSLITVSISTFALSTRDDFEFYFKMGSLALSTLYLLWRWRKEIKEDKKK